MTTHPEAAMTREQALEEAWRKRCNDPTVRNDRASFLIFQAGFDAALASAQQEPAPSADAEEVDRQIDSILERHQGAMTKAEYKAAGDEIRALIRRYAGDAATIRELEKRIGELEAGHNQHSLAMHDKLMRALEQKECAQIALTAERQRREDCEAALRPFAKFANRFGPHAREDGWQLTHSPSRTGELTMGDVRAAAEYFRKLAPPSTTEAEKQDREIVSGARYADFSNALSDVIHEALEKGMAVDEAVCIGAGVLADYARNEYGPEYLPRLAGVIIDRAREPMPADISRQ